MKHNGDEFNLTENFLNKYKRRKVKWGPLGKITYKRTYARPLSDSKVEEWWQTVQRVVEGCYLVQKRHCRWWHLPWNEWQAQHSAQQMYDLIFNFKFLPPGRGLWSMGTEFMFEKGGACLNNCGFVSTAEINQDFSAPFVWLMDMSMLGVGVGFDTLGAAQKSLLKLKSPKISAVPFIIEDSREGWTSAFERVLDAYVGKEFLPESFNYSQIRPAGSPIKTFGGVAPGPDPLRKLIERTQKLLDTYVTKNTPIDSTLIVDLMNFAGAAVVAGGIRRTAQIAFGSPLDQSFIRLKDHDNIENTELARWASNNSLIGEVGETNYDDVAPNILANGEPGILWLENARAYGRLKDKPNYRDRRAAGSNPCITGDALVSTTKGLIRLDQCKYGTHILVDKQMCGLGDNHYIKNWIPSGTKEIYRLETKEGYTLKCTHDHKILTPNNHWTPLHNLTIGDKICIQSWGGYFGKEGSYEKGACLGWLIGDGHINKTSKSAVLDFYEKDKPLAYIFEKFVKKLIQSKLWILPSVLDIKERNLKQIKSTRLLQELGLPSNTNKFKLPDWIYQGSQETLKGFLSALFEADGCPQGTLKKGVSIRLSQANKEFLQEIQKLLLSFNIKSQIYLRKEAGKTLLPDSNRQLKYYNTKSQYELIISNQSVNKYKEHIGFISDRKNNKLNEILKTRKRTPNKDVFEATIISITDEGYENVYDITEPKTHSFIANGVVVHNCGEQTLEPFELCVRGNTRLQTRTHGTPRIDTLVNKKVEIWNGQHWAWVTPVQTHPNASLIRVHMSDGSYIDCTDYHKFIVTPKTKQLEREVSAINLQPGDTLPTYDITYCDQGKHYTNAYEYGLFAGDGYLDRSKPMLALYNIPSSFNIKYLSAYKPYTPNNYNSTQFRFKLDLDPDKAAQLRRNDIGLPDFVFEMDRISTLKFLGGLIDTDGSIQKNPNTESYRIYGNEHKIRDLQLLCRRININHATVRLMARKGDITNKGVRNYDMYYLSIPSYECKEISQYTQLKPISKFGNTTKINNAHKKSTISIKSRQRVKTIERLPDTEPVYCFIEPLTNMAVFGNSLTKQCNLVESFPSLHRDLNEYEKTLKYAYLYAKTVTLVNTHDARTNAVMFRNRRIGLSQSGIIENINRIGAREHFDWCDRGYDVISEWDEVYSDWLCVPRSIKRTTVKPSGTVSLLPGVTPGIHFPHSEYYIRRIRISANSSLWRELKDAGYKVEKDTYADETMVVEFPVHEKYFSKRKNDVSIWEQMELAAQMQHFWSDNQVSITVTVPERDTSAVTNALELYETRLKSISFLPIRGDTIYKQAPYEEIEASIYKQRIDKINELKINPVDDEDRVIERFCDGDTCEIPTANIKEGQA